MEMTPVAMCPMAETCKGMMEKPPSGFMLMVPGIALIILGVLVVIEPQIIVWLVAVTLIVMGISILILAKFMRRIGKQLQKMHG